MNYTIKEGKLTVKLVERIDSSNAEEIGTQLDAILAQNPCTDLVLDAENLQYISSAGLRVVLRLRKLYPTLAVINVNADVYEIFDMTGFAEMITVEKAFRRFSVDGCEVIGEGANGKVYRLDAETIIKVYKNPDSLDDIKRERELAKKAFVAGIPTAISYDVVRVGESYGSVFELLEAKSFAKLIIASPEKMPEYVKMYTDVLKNMHATDLDDKSIDSAKVAALGWVEFDKDYLPEKYAKKLYELVSAVPESNRIIHGDYHVKNIMMQNGEAVLIDMDTLRKGNPVFEFAPIYAAYQGFSELDSSLTEEFLGIDRETTGKMWRLTLEYYFGTSDKAVLDAYETKARIVAYAKLIRHAVRHFDVNEPSTKALLDFYVTHICDLLDHCDDVAF